MNLRKCRHQPIYYIESVNRHGSSNEQGSNNDKSSTITFKEEKGENVFAGNLPIVSQAMEKMKMDTATRGFEKMFGNCDVSS